MADLCFKCWECQFWDDELIERNDGKGVCCKVIIKDGGERCSSLFELSDGYEDLMTSPDFGCVEGRGRMIKLPDKPE